MFGLARLGGALRSGGLLRGEAVARSACRSCSLIARAVPAPVGPSTGALPRPPHLLPSLALAALRSSSSLAGLERSGRPRMERDAKGRALGPQKGGKGKRLLGGVISIKNTWNNTLVSISNLQYKQLGRVTGGSAGFKKSKRSSQFATEKVISDAFTKAKSYGIKRVMLSLSGPAISLRKPLFKGLRDELGLRIMKLRMNDNVPHGGCRPRKSRRRRWRTKARKGGR